MTSIQSILHLEFFFGSNSTHHFSTHLTRRSNVLYTLSHSLIKIRVITLSCCASNAIVQTKSRRIPVSSSLCPRHMPQFFGSSPCRSTVVETKLNSRGRQRANPRISGGSLNFDSSAYQSINERSSFSYIFCSTKTPVPTPWFEGNNLSHSVKPSSVFPKSPHPKTSRRCRQKPKISVPRMQSRSHQSPNYYAYALRVFVIR